MNFELLTEPVDVENLAVNLSIRERDELIRRFGGKRWRKVKGNALVRLPNGETGRAEVHWYEANGVGKRKFKFKRWLD